MALRNAFEEMATEATLAAIEAKTPALASGRVPVSLDDPIDVAGTVAVSNFPSIQTVSGTVAVSGTVPVSASALPLPTGAATEATLSLVVADIGDVADAEATGNGSAIAILKRIRALLGGAGALSVPPAALTSYTQAGVISINTVLTTLDCSQFRSVSIQCVSMGTAGVVTPEWSNDNTNWLAATMLTAAGATAATFNAAGLWVLPVMARHLRLRLSTATTAGTTTLSVHQFNDRAQMWLATQPVSGSVTVSGTVTASGGTISPLTVAGVSIEASAARTTTANGTTITNASGNGAMFFVSVTAATGTTPTLVVQLQVQDPVSLGWIDIIPAVTPTITGTGMTMLTVCPGISEAANSRVAQGLPRVFRFRWTIGGTTPSFTFSIGAQYLI